LNLFLALLLFFQSSVAPTLNGFQFTNTNSSASLFAGYASFKDELTETGSYTASSLINAGGDLTINAGNNINQIGSNFNATNDVNIFAGGDFTSLAGVNTETMHKFHEQLMIGFTATISSSALATADTINKAVNNANASKGAYKGLGTGLAALQGAGAAAAYGAGVANGYSNTTAGKVGGAEGAMNAAAGVSVSLSFGFSQSSNTQDSSMTTSVVSNITAGHDLSISAHNVTLQGTQAIAGHDLAIDANSITMLAALNGYKNSSSSESTSASVGVSAGVNVASGGGFGDVSINASFAHNESQSNGHGTSNINALLAGSGAVTLVTRGDLTIKGGTINAGEASLTIGGNFGLTSMQDTSLTTGSSSGFGMSVGLNLATGLPSASLTLSGSNTNGASNWIVPSSVQTLGRLDVYVGSATTVTGAMMSSSSGALTLNTGSLRVTDLADSNQLHTSGGSVTAGFANGRPTGSVSITLEDKDKQGITRGTIGAGTVIIRDLTVSESDAFLESLNRNPANFRQITKDVEDVLKAELDLTAIAALPDNLKAVANLIVAISAPMPDSVAGLGSEYEDYYRRLLAQGKSPTKAEEFINSEAFQTVLENLKTYQKLDEDPNADPKLKERVAYLIAMGFKVGTDESGKPFVLECSNTTSWCKKIGIDPKEALDSKQVLKVIQDASAALEANPDDIKAKNQLYFAVRCAMSWTVEGGNAEIQTQLIEQNRSLLIQAASLASNRQFGQFDQTRLNQAFDMILAVNGTNGTPDLAKAEKVLADISALRQTEEGKTSQRLYTQEILARELVQAIKDGDTDYAKELTASMAINTQLLDESPLAVIAGGMAFKPKITKIKTTKENTPEGIPEGRVSSQYLDISASNRGVRNVQTDVTRSEFERNLLNSGYVASSPTGNGSIRFLTNGTNTYRLRDGATSTGGPTADFLPNGVNQPPTIKIRLQ
jgi:hypothetical protein